MIHGLLVLNKPRNISSHDMVERVRKIFPGQKVGHFGTLDPLAEGLLLVGIGRATKLSVFFMKKKKIYNGRIKFGYATSTYDLEGEPLTEKKEVDLNKCDINTLLDEFRGEIEQIPPMYSAKKYKGRPLYKYARENKQFDLKPVKVNIYSLKGKIERPDTLWFEAETSSGTYIRSLAHDMGQKLGTGAFLEELKRVGIGEYSITQATEIDQFSGKMDERTLLDLVKPIEILLPEFPKVIVNQNGRRGVLNGKALMIRDIITFLSIEAASHYRLFDEEGRFLAIARMEEGKKHFKPFIVFSD